MLNEHSKSICRELNLIAFSQELEYQEANGEHDKISEEERLDLALTAQLNDHNDKIITRLKKQASLPWKQASLAELNYLQWNKVKRASVERFASCQWIQQHKNIGIIGPQNSDKGLLACAIANQALMRKFKVLYFRFEVLLLRLVAAEKAGELTKFRRELNRAPVIFIGGWSNMMLTSTERHLLYEFVEQRQKNLSLLITSDYPISDWQYAYDDPDMGAKLIKRITCKTYFIDTELKCPPSVDKRNHKEKKSC